MPSVGRLEVPKKLIPGVLARGPEEAAAVGPKLKSMLEYEKRSSFTALCENVCTQFPVNAWAGPPCRVSNGGSFPGVFKKNGLSVASKRPKSGVRAFPGGGLPQIRTPPCRREGTLAVP